MPCSPPRFPPSARSILRSSATTSAEHCVAGPLEPLEPSAAQTELTAYNNVFNPANGEKATLKYATSSAGRVIIKLYTITGTYIATLLDAEKPAGKGSLDWNGRNINGAVVASGVYLVRIEAPGIRKTQKVAIIK